jgi:hypothetical protein
MTAASIESQAASASSPERFQPEIVPVSAEREHLDERTARVEKGVFRDALVGALVGALVLAPTWAAMMWLAIHNAGTALGPPVATASGIGVFAGVFMGGWAGTLVGGTKLEHFEHETRPKVESGVT